MGTWQIQAAKQRLSEMLREAEAGEPQYITRHGKTVAVVVDIEGYRATIGGRSPRPTLLEFLLSGARADDLDDVLPVRVAEADRPLELGEDFGT